MDGPSSTARSESLTKTIMDLDDDALARCARYLSLQDVSNMAMTCKSLKRAAYSDSIWQRFYREHWPHRVLSESFQSSAVREAFLARHAELHKLKFDDPLVTDFYTDAKPFDHILLDKDNIIFSEGSKVQMVRIGNLLSGTVSNVPLNHHNARITCMRSFPLVETSLYRNETQRDENVLLTSSSDHSIRLWWKLCQQGSCQRCFRGHNAAVSTLSDKLLGDGSGKVLASGGEDGTVRLWSLRTSGKRGQHALKATLYGHGKPVKLMSVAGHKTTLLASISSNAKVRVWDATVSTSSSWSSCCVGMTSVPGSPVAMKSHESLLYVAAGSAVVAIDLRTMQKAITAARCQPKLFSFAMLPSEFLICSGGDGKALLWDIRRNQDSLKPEAVAEMDGHQGPITQLHMDPYKIVTGGPDDAFVNVYETGTSTMSNRLMCCNDVGSSWMNGCSKLAVRGCQVITTSYNGETGLLRFIDFANAKSPIVRFEDENASKFWGQQSDSDSDT